MRRVNQAFQSIGTAERRQAYDQARGTPEWSTEAAWTTDPAWTTQTSAARPRNRHAVIIAIVVVLVVILVFSAYATAPVPR